MRDACPHGDDVSEGNSGWMQRLVRQLALDAAMAEALDDALTAAFHAATGQDLDDYELVPPLVGLSLHQMRFAPPTREGDRLVVEGELLNIDGGFPVRLSWRVDEPSSARWDELPVDDILYAIAERRNIELPSDLPFPVAIGDPVWPHVRIIVALSAPLSAEKEKAIVERFNRLFDAWSSEKGAFHGIGTAPRTDPDTLVIKVDFGSTDVEALHALLHLLADAELPAAHLRLD